MPILDRPMKMLMMHPTQFTMGLLGLRIVCMHEAQIYVYTHQMRKINCSTNITGKNSEIPSWTFIGK